MASRGPQNCLTEQRYQENDTTLKVKHLDSDTQSRTQCNIDDSLVLSSKNQAYSFKRQRCGIDANINDH